MSVPATRQPSELGIRAQPTLRLALGYRDPERRMAPVKTDYFVAVEGRDDEYRVAADKFRRVYGDKPRFVRIRLPAALAQALDIRHFAWASTPASDEGGILRARGQTNFAIAGLYGGADTLTVWEEDGTLRELDIAGADDEAAVALGVKLETRFRFHIPDVLGLTGYAEVTTRSVRSTDNLYRHLAQLYGWFGPLASEVVEPALVLRRAKARPLLIKDGKAKRTSTTFYALDLYVPDTLTEIRARLAERRELMLPAAGATAPPPARHPLLAAETWEEALEQHQAEAEYELAVETVDEGERIPFGEGEA